MIFNTNSGGVSKSDLDKKADIDYVQFNYEPKHSVGIGHLSPMSKNVIITVSADLNDSAIDIYTSKYGFNPTNVETTYLSPNAFRIKLTFEPINEDVDVRVIATSARLR